MRILVLADIHANWAALRSVNEKFDACLFAGDLVENEVTPYAGDGHYGDWPKALRRLRDMHAETVLPGRGDPLVGEEAVEEAMVATQAFVVELYGEVLRSAEADESLKQAYDKALAALEPRFGKSQLFQHRLPFGVARAYDEAKGLDHPRLWTVERDQEVWTALVTDTP